jgi:hypothetical protein
MPTINVQLSNATPDEQRVVDFVLSVFNQRRAEQSQPPFANISEVIEWEVANRLFTRWTAMESDARIESGKLMQRYKLADDTTRDQIDNLLPSLP